MLEWTTDAPAAWPLKVEVGDDMDGSLLLQLRGLCFACGAGPGWP